MSKHQLSPSTLRRESGLRDWDVVSRNSEDDSKIMLIKSMRTLEFARSVGRISSRFSADHPRSINTNQTATQLTDWDQRILLKFSQEFVSRRLHWFSIEILAHLNPLELDVRCRCVWLSHPDCFALFHRLLVEKLLKFSIPLRDCFEGSTARECHPKTF